MAIKNRQLVSTHGLMWARNKDNIRRLASLSDHRVEK